MPELLLLFLIAFVLIIVVVTAMYIREARRPPRRTFGWALARGLPAEPADRGLAVREWTIARPDGTELPVWEIEGRGAGHGQERTIVFVHGWGQSRINMLSRIDPYLDHAKRIVLYDLRGHGDAAGISRLSAGEGRDLMDLIAGFDHDDPITLVAFSMGATIAMDAARGMKNPPERIIAYGIARSFHVSFIGRVRRNGLPAHPFTTLAMLWFRARGLHHENIETLLEGTSCPVHLLHGINDSVSPVKDVEAFATSMPHVSLHAFDESEHLDMQFAESERHQQVINAIFTMYR